MNSHQTEFCIEIIQRQWKHRNHDVFGPLAKRQIRTAIRKLRGE